MQGQAKQRSHPGWFRLTSISLSLNFRPWQPGGHTIAPKLANRPTVECLQGKTIR